ncbi:hypothetical protein Avbf_13898 [Armadillidium vulgare]|nr:hypothetical protein Avbf_13898 [Armadillidium vulgare]
MKIEVYNGQLIDLINKTFDVFSKRVQAGDDKTVLCARYELWYEKYFAFETRSSDAWVLSFPKQEQHDTGDGLVYFERPRI